MKISKKLLTGIIVFCLTQLHVFSLHCAQLTAKQENSIDAIKFVILHDNNTTAENAWYRWMETKLNQLGFLTHLDTLPSNNPSNWFNYLKNRCNQNTIIIGHGAGAQIATRYAEDNKVCGLILTEAIYIKEMLQSCACENMYHLDDLLCTNKAIFIKIVNYLINHGILEDTPELWLKINASMPDKDEFWESGVRKVAREMNLPLKTLRDTLQHEASIAPLYFKNFD